MAQMSQRTQQQQNNQNQDPDKEKNNSLNIFIKQHFVKMTNQQNYISYETTTIT